jgi:hypothetical protein
MSYWPKYCISFSYPMLSTCYVHIILFEFITRETDFCGRMVGRPGPASWDMVGFCISGVEPSGPAAGELVN